MLLAAILAIVGARLAAGSAYRRANKLHWEEAEFQRVRDSAPAMQDVPEAQEVPLPTSDFR
jgi:uncharacterized membrane protein YjgN (DUF898 family)